MKQLRRDGVALAYEEAGSGAPPIMLVHDLAADHTSFKPQFEHFRRHHRVVAVDWRGHGQSDKPNQACTVALLADDLAWLCYELGLYRPLVLGHGLGGRAALDLASRYPDLPSAIVVVAPAAAPQGLMAPATPLARPRYVAAPLMEEISNWGYTAATAGGSAQVLYLALGTRGAGLNSQLEDSPNIASSLGAESPQPVGVTLPGEINHLVNQFLAKLANRAPP